ncbi:MAG: ABC transporter substrate-binding protein [Candidatus Competibacteraceae bacterium]|nr:ABC transporter substrate-binding protein [Candidatus Competibacteraceae bacterium]
MLNKILLNRLLPAAVLSLSAVAVQANELNLYCSAQIEWCEAMSSAFSRETGIRVNMTRKSSGETYAQLKAESANPRGDVWWGGTGDPHVQAAEEGLSQEYRSPRLDELQPWSVRQAEASNYRTVGIYAGALGYGYNTEWLDSRGLTAPTCWADLVKPEFKGEVQIANPNSSGTAYTTLATLVQLFGEDEGFAFMQKLHANINEYTKSGSAPVKAAARGETGVGIVFMHDAVQQAVEGFPVAVVAPCEGTGYEIGSMSIIAGAPNLENAKTWYDWALSAEAQAIAATVNAFQVPSNRSAPLPPQAPRLSDIKLIDYDFSKYGSSAERSRLLAKWDAEVGNLPR